MLFSAGFPAGVPEYLKDCRPNLEPENRTDLRGAYKCIDIGGRGRTRFSVEIPGEL